MSVSVICTLALVLTTVLASSNTTEGGKELIPLPPILKGLIREDCFEKFQLFDFSDVECIKFTISKGIGLAIVVGSGILKVPQIIKILQNSSVEGLAPISMYIETTIFMQTAGQGKYSGLSFTVYGESFIIFGQNCIIILLIWLYNKNIGMLEKLVIFAFLIGYAFLLFDPLGKAIIQDEHWKLITSSSTFMNIMAKVPQILTIYSNKSTGALAFFTFFLNFAGSIARLGTVLVESDDFLFRLQYIVGVLLNTIIIIQFFLYWNSSSEKAKAPAKVHQNKTGVKEKKNKLE